MQIPHVSFVVPLFNHLEQTVEMLDSLLVSLPEDLNFEIIFVDDFSTDGTRDWLQSLNQQHVSYSLNDQNFGYAKTNNRGVKLARGEYLCLLNNDLIFKSGWFEPMLDTLKSNELNAGIVGNVQFRVIDHALDHSGVVLTPRGHFDHVRTLNLESNMPYSVYAATGACLLMRKADFELHGGFDETFINGCEDIDLCLKFANSGQQIYVNPTSQIRHHVSLSRSRTTLQNERNSQYLYSKWRRQIKLQLSKNWIELLRKPKTSWQDYIDGELTDSMLTQPHLAATAIAEAALQREEARWARELGQPTISDSWTRKVQVKGLTHVPQLRSYLAAPEIEFKVDELKTAQNFYVCGRLLEDFDPKTLAVSISLNGQQFKAHRLEKGHVINVGLINPLINPAASNRFLIQFFLLNDAGEVLSPAKNAVLISHFVVDDQVINQLSS